MTYRTKLVSTKKLYLVQFISDNGLAIVDESKFISKANLEIGGEKVIKYGSKNFDIKILGTGTVILLYTIYINVTII